MYVCVRERVDLNFLFNFTRYKWFTFRITQGFQKQPT